MDNPETKLLREEIPLNRVPESTKNFFGHENIEDLLDFLNNEEFHEADVLLHSGEIEINEFCEYLYTLPNYNDARLKIRRIAKNIANRINSKWPYYFEKEMKKTSPNIANAILKILKEITSFIEIFIDNGIGSYRNARMLEIKSTILSNFSHYLAKFFTTEGRSMLIPEVIRAYKHYDKFIQKFENSEQNLMGDLHTLANFDKNIHDNRQNIKDFFNSEFSPMVESSKNSPADLRIENEMLIDDIRNLSEFRRIEMTEYEFENLKIQFFGDEYPTWEETKVKNICIVRIFFDKNLVPKGPFWFQNNQGNSQMYHYLQDGIIEFYMDRADGDFFPGLSQIPLSEILSPEDFGKLGNIIYQLLFEYLENKEEDIPVLLVKAIEKIRKSEETVEDIRLVPKETADNLFKTLYEPEPLADRKTESEPEKQQPEPKKPLLTKRGLPAGRVHAAFERILGKPRIPGGGSSHRIYTGKNGRKFPVPYHKGEDTGFGLLKRALKVFEITDEEFLAAI